jgi:hypothetical protein
MHACMHTCIHAKRVACACRFQCNELGAYLRITIKGRSVVVVMVACVCVQLALQVRYALLLQ